MRIRHSLLSVSFAIAVLLPRSGAAAGASITVQQKSPIETLGTWTLLYPSSEQIERTGATAKVEGMQPGRYTVIIRPPEGMDTVIELARGSEVVATADHPQVSFEAMEGDAFSLTITYAVHDGGKIGISSDPTSMPFELTGPDGLKRSGVTPAFFEDFPQGNYSVQYKPNGCPPPPAKSGRMGAERRVDFSIKITCSTFQPETSRETQKPGIVKTDLNGQELTFIDVPSTEWFAPYVATVARRGILTGYRDENGAFTGMFGPGNPVTIAELSKIADEMGFLNEKAATQGIHKAAEGTWFEAYFDSAYENGWLVYQDPDLDPSRPATRAEVVATLLQVIDVPVSWPKGKTFADVFKNTKYAGAVETAAALKLVEGSEGNLFHPEDPINRAEISKILIAIQEKYQQKYDRDDAEQR